MPALTIDPISARTLPALDKLWQAGDEKSLDKLEDIIMATDGPALKRILTAAISLHIFLGRDVDKMAEGPARLLELLIHENLVTGNVDPERAQKAISLSLDRAGEGGLKVLLSRSLTRYNLVDEPEKQNRGL